MKNFWVITVKKPWCDKLISGEKTMELRRQIPCIQEGDIIFVCRKGSVDIVGAFEVKQIIKRSVDYFCQDYVVSQHRVPEEMVKKYAERKEYLYGLKLWSIKYDGIIKNWELGMMRNPQNFCRIKSSYYYKIPKHILWA